MDIDVGDVHAAIEAGDIGARSIGEHHPITGAGLTRWIQVVGMLRRRLASGRNWRGDNPRNRPISRHTSKPYTLSTVGGTDATGIVDHARGPLAANKKGRATAEAVTGTLTLIEVDKLLPQARTFDAATTPPSGNWFLVYYRDDEEIRVEISLPLGFSEGQFTGWLVRVILDSWTPPEPVTRPLDVGGQDVDFEVREVG
ncbi:hypothetical protein [Mycolicibacterium wolinskyi]|nr:hypothetical protein [Mycolicibacterium wolinskyi]